jgi:altronate hydrolase
MDAIVLNPKDNIAVALRDIFQGELLQVGHDDVTSLDQIPCGHKIAISDIPKNNPILKYGMSVGKSITDIGKGRHVHVHNVKSLYVNNEQDHYE